jgi:hypothetical protein
MLIIICYVSQKRLKVATPKHFQQQLQACIDTLIFNRDSSWNIPLSIIIGNKFWLPYADCDITESTICYTVPISDVPDRRCEWVNLGSTVRTGLTHIILVKILRETLISWSRFVSVTLSRLSILFDFLNE